MMPVEIKELVIKATVLSEGRRDSAQSAQTPSSDDRINREQIIEECVEQVLSIIERKKER